MTGAFRSGFVTVVGRPNTGKSTLVNRLVGAKVAIVSQRPQTTRGAIRGVRTTPESQIVFVDTPGIHRPRTPLGERTNARASAALEDVDVVCQVVDATEAIGPGDRFVAGLATTAGPPALLAVNKVDAASPGRVVEQLARAAELGEFAAFVPLSAATGEGTDVLLAELEARLPDGPRYYPEGTTTDQPVVTLAAELVREKLLAVAREELPHSIAVTVEELEAPDAPGADPDAGRETQAAEVLRFRAVVRVERDSQKGIVIGKGGLVLRDAGTAARRELEALLGRRVHLETFVTVDHEWQRRPRALDRLGF